MYDSKFLINSSSHLSSVKSLVNVFEHLHSSGIAQVQKESRRNYYKRQTSAPNLMYFVKERVKMFEETNGNCDTSDGRKLSHVGSQISNNNQLRHPSKYEKQERCAIKGLTNLNIPSKIMETKDIANENSTLSDEIVDSVKSESVSDVSFCSHLNKQKADKEFIPPTKTFSDTSYPKSNEDNNLYSNLINSETDVNETNLLNPATVLSCTYDLESQMPQSCDRDLKISSYSNNIENVLITNPTTSQHPECKEICDTKLEAITINVSLSKSDESIDDLFGKVSIDSLEGTHFLEAYNRLGDELSITSVAELEHENYGESNNLTKLELGYTDLIEKTAELNTISKSEKSASLNDLHEENTAHVEKNENVFTNNSLEDIQLRQDCSSTYDRTIKTETVYDVYKNPRIAKVSNVKIIERISQSPLPSPVTTDPTELFRNDQQMKIRKHYIIEELITTEKQYIKHLKNVILHYMPVLMDPNLPSTLLNKSPSLFSNIKKIYSQTKKFYVELKNCNYDHEKIAKTFLEFDKLFSLYPWYYKNKPTADLHLMRDFKDIVKDCELNLNDRLGLGSHLLTPIQRMAKYKLFLEQLQKELVKNREAPSKNISDAINLIHKSMTKGNDYIAIDSISFCPFNLYDQGSFIFREKFSVLKPKKYEAVLFLFEKVVIFTSVNTKHLEQFIYRDNIKLNEMGIVTFEDEPLIFHLKRFSSYKKGPKDHCEFIIEAKRNRDKKLWTEEIEKRLWEQLLKRKEEQRELQKTEQKLVPSEETSVLRKKKIKYRSLPNRTRKVSNSQFYTN